MNEKELAIQLEAVLFALGYPLSKKELAKKLDASESEVESAARYLKEQSGRGIVLVDDGTELSLRAAASAASLIETIRREEFSREIGRAGIEALAAILYRGPLTRSEIDFIRGVNSSQTLRTLLMRGLVRKVPNPKDERSFLYEPTVELLSELGVTSLVDLPEFSSVRQKLSELEAAYKTKEAASES